MTILLLSVCSDKVGTRGSLRNGLILRYREENMIVGIGVDLVKIGRIEKAGKGHPGFLERVFTQREQDYCNRQKFPAQHYAARFASKEAVLKAFGTGLSAGMKWTDVEVLHGEGGGPIVNISGAAKDLADLKGVKQIML